MPLDYQIARQRLQDLVQKYESLSDEDRRQMTEASVVRQFVDILFRDVLDWPIQDPARYIYELHTQVGRPDLTLIPERGGTIFLEAKRFGVIKQLQQARKTLSGTITPGQLALPGMAVDRTEQEQQAINYAFQNGGTWAILTNFEIFRLFNARRDWLVLSFEEPSAYLHEFDMLWELSYERVINGSLDALSNQRHTEEVDSDYLAFINEWRERLAQDIVGNTAQNGWVLTPSGEINLLLLRSVVQQFLDRLVIIRFAEDHLVIPPGTLRNILELRQQTIYTFTMDQFIDQFFRQFDANHNSALFSYGVVDEATFSDAALLPLVAKLYEARYRAMPADILGNTYEQYLGKALALDNGSVKTRDNLETRKKQGSYYTPQVIVRYLVDNSLGRYLYGTQNGRPDGEPIEGETRKTTAEIADLRILDSACGSGSFLIYAYYVLAEFYETEVQRIEREINQQVDTLAAQGMNQIDIRIEVAGLRAEAERIENYPRLILERHLYGVDLDPQAAEIAVINLMMRAMERRHREKRLPLILGQNVKVGNSLIGLRPDDPRLSEHTDSIAELIRLRRLLTTDPDKDAPQPEVERDSVHGISLDEAFAIPNPVERRRVVEELLRRAEQAQERPAPRLQDTAHPTYYEMLDKTRALADVFNADLAPHFTHMERVRPFHWGIEFPEVFYDDDGTLKDNPGFTIIFGNPPWEILKPDLREFYNQFDPLIESRYNRTQVETRIAELQAEDPKRQQLYETQTTNIEQTAAFVRECGDYTRQGRGDTATHKLFVERMYGMLKDGGRLGYVVPSGIYTDLGTKELREMLLNEGNIQYIFSFSNERFFFPGVDHRFKFALIGAEKGRQSDGFWAAFRFNPRVAVAPDKFDEFVANPDNLFYMRLDSLEKFSPDSLSVMEFQTRRDYEVNERVYGGNSLLNEKIPNHWNVQLNNEFHMTNDRTLFNSQGRGIPLYEGKMIHQFDGFYAEPQFWISEEKLADLASPLREQLKTFRVVHRRIARGTDERTLIATIVPPNSACEINATVVLIEDYPEQNVKLYTCGLFNSFVLDFVLRYKVSTTLNMFHVYSLPVPRLTSGNPYFDAIVPRAARLTCTRAEFAGLWGEVMGEAWDESKGATDPAERQKLRDEIDAIVAHLYGLSREDFDHILGTFPLVFPEGDIGRAKRDTLLREYDAWSNLR